MSRFVIDKKLSLLKTQSLLQLKQKEEELAKKELENQEKIKQQEWERRKKEAEEEFIKMKIAEEELKREAEENEIKIKLENEKNKKYETQQRFISEQINSIKKLNGMITDEINIKQEKILNLTNDNNNSILLRKQQQSELEKKYDETLRIVSQENDSNIIDESAELNLNQLKKEIDFLQLEIEFLENHSKEEINLINNEIESLKNQIKPEDYTLNNYDIELDYISNPSLEIPIVEESISNINTYKFIKLDEIILGLTKYNLESEDLIKYEHSNNIIDYVSTNFHLNNRMINSIRRTVMNHYNGVEIDTKFYNYCYSTNLNISSPDIFKKINNEGIFNGQIYSTKQIENLFGEYLNFYELNNKIYLKFNEQYYDCAELVHKISNITFDQYIYNIEILENNVEDDLKIMTCCFIANYERGVELLDKIKVLKNCLHCFVFNSIQIYEQFVDINQIPNTIVVLTRECGTDIIPSIQAVNFILNNYDVEYIFKFHTKTDNTIFNETTNYLINKSIEELIKEMDYDKSNCVGNPKYFINIRKDSHNKLSYTRYSNNINMNKFFIASTIFFTSTNTFKKVIKFIKNNDYHSFFINNMYDTNLVNYNNSPSHVLERVFGVIN